MIPVIAAPRCVVCDPATAFRADYLCLECEQLVCWTHAEDHACEAHASPEEREYNRRFEIWQALPRWRRLLRTLTGRGEGRYLLTGRW